MLDYEIRLLKADGSLSIVLKIAALGDAHAKMQAEAMLKDAIARAEIWRGLDLVETVTRPSATKQ